MKKLSNTEIDIQMAATGLYDYLRDLLILSGAKIPFDRTYQDARIYFGDKVVELVRAIQKDLEK